MLAIKRTSFFSAGESIFFTGAAGTIVNGDIVLFAFK